MNRIASCPVCKKMFVIEDKYNRRYCSPECRLEAKRERDRNARREKRFLGEAPKNPRQKEDMSARLTEACTTAKSLGLSYGEYMALKEGRG